MSFNSILFEPLLDMELYRVLKYEIVLFIGLISTCLTKVWTQQHFYHIFIFIIFTKCIDCFFSTLNKSLSKQNTLVKNKLIMQNLFTRDMSCLS